MLCVFVMVVSFMGITIMPMQHVLAQSTYYVGGMGASDGNPGTTTQPFATIQKAASIAVAGDIINIRTGTYRETVTPINSGTTFQPDQGATVVISGLDEAGNTGWTVHSGNIYKKAITLPVNGYNQSFPNNTTLAANQVFKDGAMQFEARWPKVGYVDDLLDRSKLRQRNSTSNWTASSITDSDIPNIPGGWVGGKIWITGWFITQTRTISSNDGTKINFPATNADLRFSQYYYLTGKLGALTQAKEWHYESDMLYFWQEDGGSPTGVEYKVRNWGFDLRGKSNITIIGLQFFGCEINADINSSNTIIDGIKAKYLNHTFLQASYFTNALQTGMKVIGPNSIIRNSEIQHGASQGIWLGENCKAENNLITDFNYEGSYACGVGFWDRTAGQVTTHNTIARMGRSAIDFSVNFKGSHLNMDISYNDIYNCLMASSDGGAIYGAIDNDITGTRIHHNWIHDSSAQRTPSADYTVGISAGMYLDQASGPCTFDHNVLWNNYEADFHTWQDDRKHRNAGKSWIYNNTFATDAGDNWYSARSYLTIVDWFFDEMRNNIFRDDVVINWIVPSETWGDVENCLMETQNPKFMNQGHGGLKGRLKSESPGIDAGVEIPGITEGNVGTPDIGAYEHGGTEWVPGYSAEGYVPDYYATEQPWAEEPTPPIRTEADPGTIEVDDAETGTGENQYEFVGSWGTSTPDDAFMETDHYTAATDDYYQIRFTGTQVKVFGEKNTAFGIVAISIDGGEETLVDSYSATRIVNTLLYTSPELLKGSHTVKVRMTGTKNDSSEGTWHTADRVIITTGTIVIDDSETGTGENQYEFVGTSWQASQPSTAYMQTDHYSGKAGDYYQVRFTGTQVEVYGEKNTAFCIVAISIDGGEETLVDCYNAEKIGNTLLFTSAELSDGSHIVKVRLTDKKNPSSASYWHTADRVVVTLGVGTFVKGINFGGDAVTIDGNLWLSHESAVSSGLAVVDGSPGVGSFTWDPTPVDSDFQNMLDAVVWSSAADMNLTQTLANGAYNVYIWTVENYMDNFRSSSLQLEGTTVASSIGTMDYGTWQKYGPYNVTVSDGVLNIDMIRNSGDPLIGGMAIFSPGGTVGIKDYLQKADECIVYPNPSNGRFSIKSTNTIKSLEVYKVSGGKVYSLNNINQDRIEELNIQSIPDGIYFIRLFDGEKSFSQKLIIRKD